MQSTGMYLLTGLILSVSNMSNVAPHTRVSDTDECYSNPCSHGATCRNTVGGFTCECAPGWTGPLCQTDDNECSRGLCLNGARCENTIGSFKCVCEPGWTGPLCDKGKYWYYVYIADLTVVIHSYIRNLFMF